MRAALKISGPRATELRRHPAETTPADEPLAPVPEVKEVANPAMTNPRTPPPLVNLEAVRTHFHRACRTRHPLELWHAVADIPVLLAELSRTRSLLALLRMTHANLLAAARATLTAARDGEEDPLFYLIDELNTHHQLPPDDLPATELLAEPNTDPPDAEEDR